ncbi:MAG: ATP-binding protein [Bacteroidales bacterium]|nr:ATP-binding protein [Bacteroidales bacterium]
MVSDIYLERNIEEVIKEASKYFSVISVTGPRQSGKSTMLMHMFPHYEYFSMKDMNIRDFAENDPVAFLNKHQHMMIDEVQKVPVLLEYIQGIVDKDPARKFLLTGSSNFQMLHSVAESLPGRAGVFELLPMTQAEGKQEGRNIDELLFNGLYPAICTGKNVSKFFYPSYVKTYIEKDVRDFLHIQDQMQFMKFVKLCAARVGALFNASEIGNEVGVDSKTIARWLSVLQASYIITLLPPYYENTTKRLVKTPKLYFNDTGLACYLLDIESPRQLARDKMRGAIFENLIVMEALKHRHNQGKDGGVYFYRDSNANEVDILIKEEGEFIAIEVKSSETYNKTFEKALKKIDSWVNCPVKRKIVVYTGDFENYEGDIELVNYSNLKL